MTVPPPEALPSWSPPGGAGSIGCAAAGGAAAGGAAAGATTYAWKTKVQNKENFSWGESVGQMECQQDIRGERIGSQAVAEVAGSLRR